MLRLAEYVHILDRRLVPVGGLQSSEWMITLFMHKGFDRMYGVDSFCHRYLEKARSGEMYDGLWHVWGDLNNPYFSWPIYAELKRK